MKQLSATDSMFVFMEQPKAPLHISPVLIYDGAGAAGGKVRFKSILQRFSERIHHAPVFRQKLVRVPYDLDRPYWVQDRHFDLEFHVRHVALPEPGDWRQFFILLARLHSHALDLSRPPWEAYVIEGLDNLDGIPGGAFALYMKIHHSAIDGATGNQIIEALHDVSEAPLRPAPAPAWQGEPEPGSLTLLSRAYFKLLSRPGRMVKIASHVGRSRQQRRVDRTASQLAPHNVKSAIRFNGDVTRNRVVGAVALPLSDVKRIKNAVVKCTVNDVLLGLVGGALRRYLMQKNELPDSSLIAAVPISTRDANNISTVGGNEVAFMRLDLRTDIEAPLARLQAINKDAVASKAYANAIGIDRQLTLLETIPSGLASLGMRVVTAMGLEKQVPIANTLVTNVPGPQFPLYFCGARALRWLGIGCPVDSNGLFHTINSYDGNVMLTFVSCREMLPDPQIYQDCIRAESAAMLQALTAILQFGNSIHMREML